MDGFTNNAIWDPNGEQIAYARAGESGHWNVFLKTVDSLAGNPKPLLRSDRSQFPESWSPDGTVLAFLEFNPETGTDIWLWSEEAGPRSFLATRFEEHNPEFSPDGDFIAYVSNESGRDEVYVRPYPTGERAWTISTDGGNNPLWSRDGRELFYRRGDAVIAVAVDRSHGFQPGASRTLFDGPYAHDFFRNYDIAPDGKRFLMVETDARPPTEVRLILDWFEELERLVPIGVPRAN
jgi:serine/threonine-protein kinase